MTGSNLSRLRIRGHPWVCWRRNRRVCLLWDGRHHFDLFLVFGNFAWVSMLPFCLSKFCESLLFAFEVLLAWKAHGWPVEVTLMGVLASPAIAFASWLLAVFLQVLSQTDRTVHLANMVVIWNRRMVEVKLIILLQSVQLTPFVVWVNEFLCREEKLIWVLNVEPLLSLTDFNLQIKVSINQDVEVELESFVCVGQSLVSGLRQLKANTLVPWIQSGDSKMMFA